MTTVQQQTVNGVRTLSLHGKQYVEVAERVNMVHAQQAEFEIIFSEPISVADRWLWKTIITINGHEYRASAEVKMNAPKNTPDGTNPFECAETSAIGRALGFAGFGSVESIASRDEILRGQPFAGETAADAQAPAPAARRPASAPAPRQQPARDEAPALPHASQGVPPQPAPLMPDLNDIKASAEKHITGGWAKLRAHMIREHEMGDAPDEAFTKELRLEMLRLIAIRARKAESSQQQPAPATT